MSATILHSVSSPKGSSGASKTVSFSATSGRAGGAFLSAAPL